MSKQTLVFDLETYTNYFLCAFKNVATGSVKHFEMFDGQPFDCETVRKIVRRSRLVGFNSNSYDMPLLSMAMSGADNAKLKRASDAIIKENLRVWQVEKRFNFETFADTDHIDLIEVAPGMVSLKVYGGRLHTPEMQDLPIAPDALISPSDRARLREYCQNDLDITQSLYEHLGPQIALREAMGAEYEMDLRSKSDAQIAEHVIKSQVAKLKKKDVASPDIPEGTTFRYRAPKYVGFKDPALTETLAKIQAHEFTVLANGSVEMPEWMAKYRARIGDGAYKMGIGGLHSTESCVAHVADENTLLKDVDVRSFYPSIILTLGFAPAHMGVAFSKVYQSIYDNRLKAKDRVSEITKRISEIEKELVNAS